VEGDVVGVHHVDRLELEESRNVERQRREDDGGDGGSDAVQRADGGADPAARTAGDGQQADGDVAPDGNERRQPDGRHLTDKEQRREHHARARPPSRLERLVDADELEQRRQRERVEPADEQGAVGERETAEQERGGRRQRGVEAERGERQTAADDAGDADGPGDRHVRVEPADGAAVALARRHHHHHRRLGVVDDVQHVVVTHRASLSSSHLLSSV